MKLTKNCYAITGLGYMPPWTVNSGFITGETKTLVIDSGPNFLSSQTIYGYAKNVKSGNEILLINSEKHLDHVGGNSFFKEKGIKIYGHELLQRKEEDLIDDKTEFNKSILNNVRREEREEEIFYENTKIVNPDLHVSNGQIISLGGNTEVSIIYTPGHTQTNISVFVPEEKVLYCGDCLTNRYIPNLEAGTKEDWIVWLKSLELISSLDLEYIVPGHGNVIKGREIKTQILRMSGVIEQAIEYGKAPTT